MTAPVIVGYDGRDPARDALALGAALAQDDKPLVTAYVTEEDHLSTATDTRVQRERHALREDLRSDVLARSPAAGATGKPEMVLVPGLSPAAGLHDVAKEFGCAALVVGSTHHGSVGRVLMGTTAGKLLDAGRCAVAIAPRGLSLRNVAIRTIGVGIDNSPESRAALETTLDLAASLRAEVVALSAGHSDSPHLHGLSLDTGGEIQTVSLEGRPAPALARAGGDFDLLVVGSPGRRHHHGSVRQELARTSPVPLLVVPRANRS